MDKKRIMGYVLSRGHGVHKECGDYKHTQCLLLIKMGRKQRDLSVEGLGKDDSG